MKIIPPQKLWQWDINKKVYISGITDADEWQVHFAADDDRTALVLSIKHDDSGYWAYIPNQLVSEGRLLLCYLYNQVEDWAHTETMIKIPVLRRPKPAGYTLVLTDIETRGSLREDIGNLSSLTTQTQNSLVDAINEVNSKKHNDLYGRDAADVHPMSSITGLEQRLQSIDSVGTGQAKAIAQLKQDIETNEATDKSQSKAISSMQQSISSIQSASESNAAAISDMQVSISSINDVDYIQSQAIADVEAALDNKQPVGNYVTSVNGTTPDKNGNINIDVQTYTAGNGISIDEGAISVKNPMDDEQVSEATTWSSAKTISSVSQPFSQSGSIITCQPVEGSELHVVSEITAVQEGEGDPSPDNVRPISGWDSASLTRCGKNLLPQTYKTVSSNGVTYTVRDDKSIVISGMATGYSSIQELFPKHLYIKDFYYYIKSENANNIAVQSIANNSDPTFLKLDTFIKYTGSTNFSSVVFTIKRDNNNRVTSGTFYPMIVCSNTDTTYEPYRGQTYTADLPETVYGGTLDWTTGVLTVTWARHICKGDEFLRVGGIYGDFTRYYFVPQVSSIGNSGKNNIICNQYKTLPAASAEETGVVLTGANLISLTLPTLEYSSTESVSTLFKQKYDNGTPIIMVYRILSPYTIQLTPAQILAISGINTIYCNTGDVTVTGYEDPRHTVAQLTSRIAALESAATGI